LQHGIARYLDDRPEVCGELPAAERKRSTCHSAEGSGFRPLRSQGTYFQLLDFSALSADADTEFAERLIVGGRVALIPLSPSIVSAVLRLLRICIAKDET
jgi:methionine aminotransferase